MDNSKTDNDAQSTPPKPSPSRWRKVAFALQAIEVRMRFIGILVLIGLVFGYWDTLRNYWDKWTRPAEASTALASDTEFYCPMHPDVVRDAANPDGSAPSCPICNMPLSRRKKGEAAELMPGVLSRVEMSPEKVRMAGVATVPVNYRPLSRTLRTVGYVTHDEEKLSNVVSRTGGYVETLYVDKIYQMVKKEDPLAEVYSPELYRAAQELIVLRDSRNMGSLVDSAKEKLRLLGISETEIETIWKTGEAKSRMVIRSPQMGHVIQKNVVEGSRIEEGETLFKLADHSTVWIEADVHEKDLSMLREGQAVEAKVSSYPDRTFKGSVALIYPHMQSDTRTVRVRFELDNPGHILRPGMYATVQLTRPVAETEPFQSEVAARAAPPKNADAQTLIQWQGDCPVTGFELGSMGKPVPVSVKDRTVYLCCDGCTDKIKQSPEQYLAKFAPAPQDEVLTVPQTAVIDTGTRKIVYVERKPGVYEGIEVTLGAEVGDRYPVLSGLSPGDKVAAAGAFLIDAETRLNPAASSSYYGASGAPQSQGGESAQRRTAPESENESKQPQAGANVELTIKQLAEIAKLPPADRKAARRQKICPITEEPLGFMGKPVTHDVDGKTVYLCCPGCIEEIEAKPELIPATAAPSDQTNGGERRRPQA